MSKSTLSVCGSIFVVAFIAGCFVVIGLKYGVSPDQIDVLNFTLQQICTIEKSNELVEYNCSFLIPLSIILSVVAAIVSVWIVANRIQNWKVGLIVYGIGWIVGVLFEFSSIK